MGVPDNRCGFEYRDKAQEGTGDWTCWRETWGDYEACIWHANTEKKQQKELTAARGQEFERLDGAILTGSQLTRSLDLAGCSLNDVDFSDTQLDGLLLNDTNLRDANFSGGNLKRIDLSGANLHRANFEGASITSSSFSNSYLFEATFRRAELDRINFTDTLATQTDWVEANIRECNLQEAQFSQSNFSRSTQISVSGPAAFQQCEFSEASFRDVSFEDCNFIDCDFSGADLSAGRFQRGEFSSADFSDADLSDAQLTDAILSDTRLRGANLTGAKLASADLTGADLLYSRLNESILSDVTLTRDTRLPVSWVGYEGEIDFGELVWVYFKLSRLLFENGYPEKARQLRVLTRDAHRSKALAARDYIRYSADQLYRWTSVYGESPTRVLLASLFTISSFSIIYTAIGTESFQQVTSVYLLYELLLNLQFSVEAFTFGVPLGTRPTSGFEAALATVESLIGMGYFALFVLSLVKREVVY